MFFRKLNQAQASSGQSIIALLDETLSTRLESPTLLLFLCHEKIAWTNARKPEDCLSKLMIFHEQASSVRLQIICGPAVALPYIGASNLSSPGSQNSPGLMGASQMISPHENKASPPPSLWSFILHGNNARSLLDELIELGLCYLLSSRTFSNLVTHMHGLLLGYVLLELQKLQNFLGLFKVLLPIVFFVAARVLRFLLQHRKHYYSKLLRRFRILAFIARGGRRIVGFSQHVGCQCCQFLGKIFRNFDITLRKWMLDKFEKML